MAKISLPEWIEQHLKDREWNPADLIRVARSKGHSISDATLSRILNGDRKAGPETLLALADAFEEPPEHVYRVAGLLPPLPGPDDDLTLKELFDLARRLNPDERRRLARVARLYLQEQREQYAAANNDSSEDIAAAPAASL